MNDIDTENIEIELLIEAIYQKYGYDFRSYARASLGRRIHHRLSQTKLASISQMQHLVLYDVAFFEQLLLDLSVNVTAMFRDPQFYKAVREQIVPVLKTFPFIKIWHAGCSTGEEVYSMAILLHEEGLYERTQIYATDFNEEVIKKAREGIIPIDRIKDFTGNYQISGGNQSFSDYYTAKYNFAIMNQFLKKNIVFADHNLATDGAFGEMNLIMCRNVLIYFDKQLQNRTIGLFRESLRHLGYLCLGTKESLRFFEYEDNFEPVIKSLKIYRKLS